MAVYKSPTIRTMDRLEIVEVSGPCSTQYGTVNMDMYRGSAMLEKVSEYRLASDSTQIYKIEKNQEVSYV